MKKLFPSLLSLLCGMLVVSCSLADGAAYGGPEGGYNPSFDGDSWGEKYEDYGENPFLNAAEQPQSTFSVDSDGASYTVMRKYVNLGQHPPQASVRVEEYLNYFTYDYADPSGDHSLALDTETIVCPWNEQHLLMRIGIKGRDIPLAELPPTNYVFLIDVSGSMDSADKLGILKVGFAKLVDVLGEQDRVAIVTYSGQVQVLLPSTCCDEKETIKAAIASLSAAGSTAGGAAISMAYEIARQNYIPDGNNRIILGTDGDFNVGVSSDGELVELIESKRDQGIYITVLGVGSGNLNDSMMEKVADKGNGNYEYIDNAAQMDKVFVHERARFHTVARDTKIQLTFHPAHVEQYRLIGYENRVLNPEDFEDDAKDAGEIGAGQTVTALYELIPVQTEGAEVAGFADLAVRYKKPGNEESLLLETPVGPPVSVLAEASESTRFAAAVAAFGMRMKSSKYAGSADKAMIRTLASGARGEDPQGYRAEFCQLLEKISF